MQSVAQESQTLNNFDHVFRPCPAAAELDYLAKATLDLASIGGSPRRSAASIRALVAINRKKHRHTAGCLRCLIHEAIDAVPQKLDAQRATKGQKAVARA